MIYIQCNEYNWGRPIHSVSRQGYAMPSHTDLEFKNDRVRFGSDSNSLCAIFSSLLMRISHAYKAKCSYFRRVIHIICVIKHVYFFSAVSLVVDMEVWANGLYVGTALSSLHSARVWHSPYPARLHLASTGRLSTSSTLCSAW